eukprot:GHVL01012713.1.p1 GENE.GHVL01012713.1~~GHVL01012713.1.p1  ORF type:complete len:263 (-),score=66.86 GHVL01012713.1:404-1192(-)
MQGLERGVRGNRNKQTMKNDENICILGYLKNENYIYQLETKKIIIGRDKKRSDIFVDARGVSKKHAKLILDGTSHEWSIHDCSSNGTFVNNQRLSGFVNNQRLSGQSIPLRSGDIIQLSQDKSTSFIFELPSTWDRFSISSDSSESVTDTENETVNSFFSPPSQISPLRGVPQPSPRGTPTGLKNTEFYKTPPGGVVFSRGICEKSKRISCLPSSIDSKNPVFQNRSTSVPNDTSVSQLEDIFGNHPLGHLCRQLQVVSKKK